MIPVPFTNIALSLSGGGYRASTFHLGAMAYMDSKDFEGRRLLEHTKIISTISGGTITGVMYALKVAKGESFQECFNKLYELLEEDKLVDRALHKLNNPDKWKNKHKSRDLINAFSEVYNEHFYDEETFATLYDSKEIHLSDAIFGSSEFTYGIQFRLQESHTQGRFGNRYLNLPDTVSREIRLADATASSSCFPGGFEPMVMPHDYGNGPDSAVEKAWKEKMYKGEHYQTTAIMDGGIIDNQGIEGVKLAESREENKDKKPFIGTYLVSDVSSEMMEPYKVPILKHVPWKNWVTLNSINFTMAAIAVLLISLLFYGLPFWGIVTATSILTLMGLWLTTYIIFKTSLNDALGNMFGESNLPEMKKDFKMLNSTPLYILAYLIKFRVTSVIKMVSDIFLRRIRRLQLNSLYDDPNWNYRFKSNYIYALEKELPNLSPLMQDVVKAANSMPTTLWFTDEDKKNNTLDKLIACGQLTMCRNLIKYIDRMKSNSYKAKVWDVLTPDIQKDIDHLQVQMKEDWDRFVEDPYWLLNHYKADMTG